jgi:hypothetical protein
MKNFPMHDSYLFEVHAAEIISARGRSRDQVMTENGRENGRRELTWITTRTFRMQHSTRPWREEPMGQLSDKPRIFRAFENRS